VALDLRHTVCPSCDKAVVPFSHTVREVLKDTVEHAKVALRRAKAGAIVLGGHIRRLLSRARIEYAKLSVLGRRHGVKLSAALDVWGRATIEAGRTVGALLHREGLKIRTRMKAAPPLPGNKGRGDAKKGAQAEGTVPGMHFAWRKGYEDVTEDSVLHQQLQGHVVPTQSRTRPPAAATQRDDSLQKEVAPESSTTTSTTHIETVIPLVEREPVSMDIERSTHTTLPDSGAQTAIEVQEPAPLPLPLPPPPPEPGAAAPDADTAAVSDAPRPTAGLV
jgi:hypothetical protein